MTVVKENTGRYIVGEELYVCVFHYSDQVSISQPLVYNPNFPTDVKFKKLTVIEHHKVPQHYGDSGDLTADGYVLTDEDNKLYTNQYPRASYGQLDDRGDRVFTAKLDHISNTDDALKEMKGSTFQYVSVDEVLTPIRRTITNNKSNIEEVLLKQLIKLNDMIHKCFTAQFPNKVLKSVPIIWTDFEGKESSNENITHIVVVDKEA